MTPEQVREIVRLTIEELADKQLLRTNSYQSILKVVEPRLYHFFNSSGDSNKIGYALRTLSDDPYIDIIFLQYRDRVNLEFIASALDKDVSTIKRNKKRLICRIYELMK